ncbi:MAG: nucleoside-diphosphate kinase [Victivallaceae bacterium]|nr:nucleoside-diphosphate kinase [Victivallaceae bacterium]
MAVEVSYIIITPYSLLKSRTGGIIARLMSRTDLEFIGAQMLAFSREMAQKYADSLRSGAARISPQSGELLANYVMDNFPPREDGRKERALMLLFRGEDACHKLSEITGRLSPYSPRSEQAGETLRDTYADLVEDKENPAVVRYFEPAVMTPPNAEEARIKLEMFAKFAESSPNLIDNSIGSSADDQRTLVIIKPDNWRHPSSRPGNIIDMLSRTGLRIVGCKVHRMSTSDALEFYGSVKDALHGKLASKIGEKAKEKLEQEFKVKLPAESLDKLVEAVGIPFADDQFSQLVEFMSGRRPEECLTQEELTRQNSNAKCLVLIYEGPNAIQKIRSVLGPTDPSKAPAGTVRRDFGSDVMVNTAHASDSPASVEREMKIIRITQNSMAARIREYLTE